MKTKILFIIMLCGVICGYAQKTPTHAASTKTWTFGNQTWSDVIHIPACNKESFKSINTDPHCRSYTESGNTWYYYNWAYVNKNAATLCPSPWRVPTREDFDVLKKNKSTGLADAWGYGGELSSNIFFHGDTQAYYWSSTETNDDIAYRLYYSSSNLNVANNKKLLGFQVRCVK
jgi:hypothetical protein